MKLFLLTISLNAKTANHIDISVANQAMHSALDNVVVAFSYDDSTQICHV